MAQRISRAKAKLRGRRFELPPDPAVRIRPVCEVLYLLFNEGYTSSSGPDLSRVDLSGEAIRLARLLRSQAPDQPEVAGLLALMLLTEARRPARTSPDRSSRPTGSAGPLPVGPCSDQRRAADAQRDSGRRPRRRVPAARLDRSPPRRGRVLHLDPVGRDREDVRAAGVPDRESHGTAQPCGRSRHGRGARLGTGPSRRTRAARLPPAATPSARTCSKTPGTSPPRPRTTRQQLLAPTTHGNATTSSSRRLASGRDELRPSKRGNRRERSGGRTRVTGSPSISAVLEVWNATHGRIMT